MHHVYVAGVMRVYAGGQQPGQATRAGSNVLQADFLLTPVPTPDPGSGEGSHRAQGYQGTQQRHRFIKL